MPLTLARSRSRHSLGAGGRGRWQRHSDWPGGGFLIGPPAWAAVPRALPQVGDWSEELFRLGLESPQMPLWITAAQPSAMESSIYFENGE